MIRKNDLTLSEAFKEKLTNDRGWGFGYPNFAGLEELHLLAVDDVDEDCGICPESGDMVVYNEREGGGVIGFDHAAGEIWSIELNPNSAYYQLYRSFSKAPLEVCSEFLWERFLEISYLFWQTELTADEDGQSPLDFGFKSHSHLITEFEEEINFLKGDAHLCLYWLLVYGFLGDEQRYRLVLKTSPKKHALIQECVAFFKCFSIGDDIDLFYFGHSDKEKAFFKTAFRKRHANLIRFFEQSSNVKNTKG